MLAVILTGGMSRRMGADKATLKAVSGGSLSVTLATRYAKALGQAALSVDRPGRFPDGGYPQLVDAYPGKGPLNGLYSAFTQTDAETILLTATDLPHGDPALALRLGELLGDGDACVIRRAGGYIEPLFAVYRRTCLKAAADSLKAGRLSVGAVLRQLNVRYVNPDELEGFDLDRMLMNVNTPEDYYRYTGEEK